MSCYLYFVLMPLGPVFCELCQVGFHVVGESPSFLFALDIGSLRTGCVRVENRVCVHISGVVCLLCIVCSVVCPCQLFCVDVLSRGVSKPIGTQGGDVMYFGVFALGVSLVS